MGIGHCSTVKYQQIQILVLFPKCAPCGAWEGETPSLRGHLTNRHRRRAKNGLTQGILRAPQAVCLPHFLEGGRLALPTRRKARHCDAPAEERPDGFRSQKNRNISHLQQVPRIRYSGTYHGPFDACKRFFQLFPAHWKCFGSLFSARPCRAWLCGEKDGEPHGRQHQAAQRESEAAPPCRTRRPGALV